MLAELVIAMSERAHQSLGARAGMGVLRAAIDRDITGEDRRTLLLRGMGLAIRSDDRESFASFAQRWSVAGGGAGDRRGLSLVARLHELDRTPWMAALAEAELERFRAADALFVLAVAREREGKRDAAEGLLAESASVAGAAGDALRVSRAERELLRLTRSLGRDREAASALESASPRDALRLAGSVLAARGLYARVRALDRLHELAMDPALRSAVARIAFAHADSHGPRLSEIERDRVLQIAERAQVDPRAIAALRDGVPIPEPFRARARAALSGNLLGPTPKDPDERRDWLGLVAIGAIARSEPSAAVAPLKGLAREKASAIAWTAALTALGHAQVRTEAIACVDAWIDDPLPPPRGYVELVRALERASAHGLVDRALEQAALRNESGARSMLAARIARRAHEAYARGALDEARALIVKALALE